MKLLPDRPPLSPHERGVLVATCLSSLGSFYTMALTGFALPQIQRGLAIPEDQLGSLFALIRFGALFSLALGILADRSGRRRLLIASVIGCALCNVATAFAWSGLSFALLQMGARCFMGGQILLAGVVVSEELSARSRGFGIGLLSAVGALGGGLTLLAYAFVEQLPFGWRFLFVLGGFGLLWVPWLWRSLNETRRFSEQRDAQGPSSSAPAPKSFGEAWRLHGWRLVALIAVVAPVMVILEPGSVFISKHLQDDLGYSPGQVGLWMALLGIATPLGNMLSGTLADRFGRRPVTAATSLLLALGVGIFYNATSTLATAFGLALVLMSLGGLIVLHTALSTELFPTPFRSTASGVREAASTLGSSLGLWIAALLYDVTGSYVDSITWLLVLAPVAPLVLLFVPETAGRELEEISPEPVVARPVAASSRQ